MQYIILYFIFFCSRYLNTECLNEITQLNHLLKIYFICKHIFINSAAYIYTYIYHNATHI